MVRLTMERTTQTETRVPKWRQLLYCLAGDDRYRRKRQFDAGILLPGKPMHPKAVNYSSGLYSFFQDGGNIFYTAWSSGYSMNSQIIPYRSIILLPCCCLMVLPDGIGSLAGVQVRSLRRD